MSTREQPKNRGFEYRHHVTPGDRSKTVLDLLVSKYDHSARATWRTRIDRGEVRVGNLPATCGQALRSGQVLAWRRPPWREPPAPLGFAVLHLDPHLLAVAKPSGLPTIPGGGRFLEHTLLHQVRRRFPDVSPAHRLGAGTSGIVLFGRTARARSALSGTFRRGSIQRRYLGLVQGHPKEQSFILEQPIGPVPYPPTGQLHAVSPAGKPARTEVRLLERRADGNSVLALLILTGRSHQIRAHLACSGHPLVGDPLFGAHGLPRSGTRALPSDGGYHLHACSLRFDHPETGRTLTIECAPPRILGIRPTTNCHSG